MRRGLNGFLILVNLWTVTCRIFLPHYLTVWECQNSVSRLMDNRGDMAGWSRTRVQAALSLDTQRAWACPRSQTAPGDDVMSHAPSPQQRLCLVSCLLCPEFGLFLYPQRPWMLQWLLGLCQPTGVMWWGGAMWGKHWIESTIVRISQSKFKTQMYILNAARSKFSHQNMHCSASLMADLLKHTHHNEICLKIEQTFSLLTVMMDVYYLSSLP